MLAEVSCTHQLQKGDTLCPTLDAGYLVNRDQNQKVVIESAQVFCRIKWENLQR